MPAGQGHLYQNGNASLAGLAEAMAAGVRSAEAELDAGLKRIEEEDGRWHAMLALCPDARAAALRADEAAQGGRSLGPLHGVVLVIKDNIDKAGMATTSGCRALAGSVAKANAEILDRLINAGAVILGKSNLSEFSFEIRSRSSLGGDVLCPFAPDATAGGSSGGSAVAVVRGYAMAAIGTDTGGSIRIPAACNGLVGFRPPHNQLSLKGVAPLAPATDTIGPIARTVEDARLLYQIMGGRLSDAPSRKPRIGVVRQLFGQDAHILAATERAMAALTAGGAELIDPFHLDRAEALLEGMHIVDAQFASAFDAYLAEAFVPGTAPANLAEIVEGGAYLHDHQPSLKKRMAATAGDAQRVLERHRLLKRYVEEAMADAGLDALFFPTMQVIPDGLGNPKGGWAPELAARTGWPAISVPAPVYAGMRPVGVEILAPAGNEALIFSLAQLIERA